MLFLDNLAYNGMRPEGKDWEIWGKGEIRRSKRRRSREQYEGCKAQKKENRKYRKKPDCGNGEKRPPKSFT